MIRFVLASASPARLETLRRAGLDPEVIVSDVDEDVFAAATTAELVQLLAEAKAAAVAARVDGPALVLGCDSLLELDGASLGKPGTVTVAAERWRAMRGRRGRLWTGHCLRDVATGAVAGATVHTGVSFADVTDAEIEAYTASGEPSYVAGAFTIDGLGGWFVAGISGDPHNVVGVSLPHLRELVRSLGYELTDLGYPATTT